MKEKYRIETEVKITSKKAERFMKDPHINRNLKDRAVQRLSDDISSGGWVSRNGSNIVFDWNGKLRDGQHRCAAIIRSQNKENLLAKKEGREPKELSITVDVVKNIDPEAVRTIDIGAKRTNADTLVMEFRQEGQELKNPKIIASAVSYLVLHERGNIYAKASVSNEEIWEAFKNNLDLIGLNDKLSSLKYMVSKGIILALYKIFSLVKAHQELVHPFFEGLSTGESLSKGSPILVLRNKIIQAKNATGETLGAPATLCLIIKAWGHYVKGDKISKLVYTADNLPQPIKRRKIKAVLANGK